jgi:hypothetical protein
MWWRVRMSRRLNRLLGGRADEMLSSRAYFMSLKGSPRWIVVRAVIDLLALNSEHCRECWFWEKTLRGGSNDNEANEK